MPVYGAGSKYLGRTEKETEWLRFHALQVPGNSHCAPTQEIADDLEAALAQIQSILGDLQQRVKM
jgi:hypothetical protein